MIQPESAAGEQSSRSAPGSRPGPSHGHRQTFYVAAAILAAVAFALAVPCLPPDGALGAALAVFDLGGEVFLRLLKMVVVPLVVASVMSGILGVGDVRKLGRPGLRTVLFYLATTVLAVLLGMALVSLTRPGVGLDERLVEKAQTEGRKQVEQIQKQVQPQPDAGQAQSAPGVGYVLR